MFSTNCGGKLKVVDSKYDPALVATVRKRRCYGCDYVFLTNETIINKKKIKRRKEKIVKR